MLATAAAAGRAAGSGRVVGTSCLCGARRRRFAQRCVCGGFSSGARRRAQQLLWRLTTLRCAVNLGTDAYRLRRSAEAAGCKVSSLALPLAAQNAPSVLGLSAASAYGEALSCLRHASERPTHSGRDRVASELCICVSHRCISAARAQPYRSVRPRRGAALPQRSRPRRGGDSARRGDLSYSQRWRRRATPRAR